ncbi:hypothetical protein [Amycolatopsis sp. cmx-11-51]|uniref:hypothetical protein n=1 Tax=Amycolatopsis sp. cmx-11-51 TaxID=2785797 RepID=UPI0039E2776A
MVKSNFPVMKSGGGILPKVVGLIILLAIGVMVVKHPTDSAGWVTDAVHGIGAVLDGVVNFLRALSS